MRRTQIYLDPADATALARRARARGTTASHLIREAISEYLAQPEDAERRQATWLAALDASFGAAPDLEPGDAYVERMRGADADRTRELEELRGTR